MALCTVSQPFSLLSGRFANPVNNQGIVAMPTGQRNVLRQMVIPNNPESARQIDVRGWFAASAQAFKSLTQNQVAGWKALADQYRRTGRLDLEYTLSAVGIFNAVNWYRQANLQSVVQTAPLFDAPGTPSLKGAATDGSGLEADVDTTAMAAGQLIAVRISAPLSGARVAQRGDVRFPRSTDINAYIFQLPAPSPSQLLALDVDGLGYAPGQRIGILLQPLSATYQPGTPVFRSSVTLA